MGCGDACPYIPGKRYLDWQLEDPNGRPIDEVRATREESAEWLYRRRFAPYPSAAVVSGGVWPVCTLFAPSTIIGTQDGTVRATEGSSPWIGRRRPPVIVQDIGGVRARLPSLDHVHAVSRRLRKTWTIVRVRDYIAEPKSSGYRALHLIVRRDGYPIEVQLRTRLQDAWANQVEEDGGMLGVDLKFGAGQADIHAYYVAVSEAFALLDRGELLSDEVAAILKARYATIKDILPDEREQP